MRRTTAARTSGALALAAALALGGCGDGVPDAGPPDGAPDGAPGDAATSPAAVTPGDRLSPEELADLAAADGVVVLDVRTPEEYAQGHLPGAVNLDVSAPDFAGRAARLDPAATYAVYCRTGVRSQTAVAALRDAGIASVVDLDGGIVAWAEAGLPVTTD
ncbi:MAG: rhodanese-like domain-containing protein [Actinomycetales bacterium]|nr:rhodanese-like domain-containing protein [Actinomycetales bacterium]